MRKELRIAGAGGHGVVTASVVLAEALGRAGYNVCQTQSYGPQARGGLAMGDVVFSDGEILYPKLMGIDGLVALTGEASDCSAGMLREGAVALVEASLGSVGAGMIATGLVEGAMEAAGSETFAGIVSLGAIVSACGLCDPAIVEKVLGERFTATMLKRNLDALSFGLALGSAPKDAAPGAVFQADL